MITLHTDPDESLERAIGPHWIPCFESELEVDGGRVSSVWSRAAREAYLVTQLAEADGTADRDDARDELAEFREEMSERDDMLRYLRTGSYSEVGQ